MMNLFLYVYYSNHSFLLQFRVPAFLNDKLLQELSEEKRYHFSNLVHLLSEAPSPRHIKSHLPFSLLPPALLDTCKVVYVARDPRDVAISFYHHNRLMKNMGYKGDFKTYWNYFMKNLGNRRVRKVPF